ncbi:hypothetical protein [Paenibacillus agilis]|uniref:Fibronectin type III domain-containing protein n=1 Tax=Paenibacillus agilis TaxID=3020863 RepID=A0A559J0B0_9BACL|nr:hypothetical protein [Paenibacillus agilis]TVX93320.1 hypothetical protein FPZ44_09775 [Paenibacillus agilis]
MKKMFASVLATTLLLSAAVPAFAQNSTQAAAPAVASVVKPESISTQSTYFFTKVSWRTVPGATSYEFFVYKNGSLLEWGTQGVGVNGQNRNVGTQEFSAYEVKINAIGPSGNLLASGSRTFVALTSSPSINIPL